MEYRIESDSMGEVPVPADRYWGAQTQRSLKNFKIGTERMPLPLIRAYGLIKKAAASANFQLQRLEGEACSYIERACDEVIAGELDEHFPLLVWQTGSGTQTNMNLNEVIANRANGLWGRREIHPNDHVNMSQSSNDSFPSAMHLATVLELEDRLLPEIDELAAAFGRLEGENQGLLKIGRTHLQDATPLYFSQEVSGWRVMLEESGELLRQTLPKLYSLALGGTAVGTGLNAPEGFAEKSAQIIARLTGKPFYSAGNKFHALSSKDALVFAHGGLKALAANLMKIANDIRWLASGPRCGLGELSIPANEPGSSIMPGKVNPTQCEAVTMVAVQVMGNDTAVGIAASQGNLQLNVFVPLIIYNVLQSIELLTDAARSFRINCVEGIMPLPEKMEENLRRSLMLVTALNPHIGYKKAAIVAQKAYEENLSLKEACLELGFLNEEQFEGLMTAENLTSPL